MEYYLEFKAKPSEDLAPEIIISQVFSLCHVELVKLKSNDIGVSFPQADKSLGGVIRVHGKQAPLESIAKACTNLSDYCEIMPPRKVPDDSEWRIVKRVHPKMSAAKIRRLVKRGSISEQDAEERFQSPSELTLPYLQIRSSSTSQYFRIFISQAVADEPKQNSDFNSYGLGGSIPWF